MDNDIKNNICTLRGFLAMRMRETWRRIKELEKSGKTVTYEDFGRILHEVSDELREKRKTVCYLR
jgi:predicted SpoU family rRNA methylase